MAREAAQGARAALGTDYEQQLRKEAGPMPGKLSKRKHQIGSLFHQAKLAVSPQCTLFTEGAERWPAKLLQKAMLIRCVMEVQCALLHLCLLFVVARAFWYSVHELRCNDVLLLVCRS